MSSAAPVLARSLAILIAVVLAIPSAAAWGGRGFYEPDTTFDRTHTWMFQDAPPATPRVERVYFSAYPAYYVATVSHNLGVLQMQTAPYPTNVHFFLGAWRDCNSDGYIGVADSALLEYRSELLLPSGTDMCPAATTPDPIPADWTPTHNDGQWVREFLWIGPDDIATDGTNDGCYFTPDTNTCTRAINHTNPFNLEDHGARIWADWGLPQDAAKASCAVNPRPRGTYQSTGGFLRFQDCMTGWRETGAIDLISSMDGNAGGTSFADAPQDHPEQSSSVLNQANPYGQPGGAAIVSAWDCSSDPALLVTDPTGRTHQSVNDPTNNNQPIFVNVSGNGDPFYGSTDAGQSSAPSASEGYTLARVNQPRGAPAVNTGGSAAGTVNDTAEGAAGDCDRSNGVGDRTSNVYANDETDFVGTPPLRQQSDIFGYFSEGTRSYSAGSTGAAEDSVLGRGRSDDLGEGFAYMQSGSNSNWFGTPGYAVSRNPYVDRDSLSPWGRVYLSAYAMVSSAAQSRYALSMPSSAPGAYGEYHCSGGVAIDGAWQCDASKWWPLGTGEPGGRNLWESVPGDPYNLADVDCYDASVLGLPSVPATVMGNSCDR